MRKGARFNNEKGGGKVRFPVFKPFDNQRPPTRVYDMKGEE